MKLYLKQSNSLKQKIHMAMKQSSLLDMPKDKFWKLINEIEESKLFQKLVAPGDSKAITIIPIKGYVPCKCLYKNKDNIIIKEEPNNLYIEQILNQEKEIFNQIKKMPIDTFYYYFIEGQGTNMEISQMFNIPWQKVKLIREKIEKILLREELGLTYSNSKTYIYQDYKEVSAELIKINGKIQINFLQERIRYRLDEEKILAHINQKKLKEEDIKQITNLREKIHLINSHFNILHQIITNAVKTQEKYLLSEDFLNMKPLEEKKMARKINVDISWISRLINGKAIKRYLKYGKKYITIRSLFISQKKLKKKKGIYYIKKILKNIKTTPKKKKITDEKLKNILEKKYKIKISRRTVNNWIKEL